MFNEIDVTFEIAECRRGLQQLSGIYAEAAEKCGPAETSHVRQGLRAATQMLTEILPSLTRLQELAAQGQLCGESERAMPALVAEADQAQAGVLELAERLSQTTF